MGGPRDSFDCGFSGSDRRLTPGLSDLARTLLTTFTTLYDHVTTAHWTTTLDMACAATCAALPCLLPHVGGRSGEEGMFLRGLARQ